MQIRNGGAWRTAASAQAYINGAWRQILYGKAYVNGSWRNICNFTPPPPPPPAPPPTTPPPPPAPSLTVTASTTAISASAAVSSMTTNSVTLTPSGGKSPYSYAWTITSSDGNAYTITAPSAASTAVHISGLVDRNATCTIQCTVNDSTGLSATSPQVTAKFTFTGVLP